MPESESSDLVVAAKDTFTRRLSERFGDPFLFTFALVFITQEWRFLYALFRGQRGLKVGEAIQIASEQLPLWHVGKDVVIAGALVWLWPKISRTVRTYLAEQRVITANQEAITQRGRLLTLYELRRHPEHRHAIAIIQTFSNLVRTLMAEHYVPGARQHGKFVILAELGDPIPVQTFALSVPIDDSGGVGAVARLGNVWRKQGNGELVYVVARMPLQKNGGRALLVCAKNEAVVPWPEPHRTTTLLAGDEEGFLVPRPPDEKPNVQWARLEFLESEKVAIVRMPSLVALQPAVPTHLEALVEEAG